MYWAELWATEKNAISTIQQEINKTKNLGHWMRYCLFDKYFRQIGNAGTAGNGYNSCHYLISWYIAWGGPVNSEGWGWIIGCHSAHNGYQNPLAAYYWSNKSVPDWDKSLKTQLELAKFIQVPEGHLGEGVVVLQMIILTTMLIILILVHLCLEHLRILMANRE
jgi:hypothetical protein